MGNIITDFYRNVNIYPVIVRIKVTACYKRLSRVVKEYNTVFLKSKKSVAVVKII